MTRLEKVKQYVRHRVPPPLMNGILLHLPFLYRTKLVNYETNLESGVDELLAQLALTLGLEGDVVECGSSFCGTSVIMGRYLRRRQAAKKVYALDSFMGFDRRELAREVAAGLATAEQGTFTFTSYDYVTRKVARLGLADTVIPVRGFFAETLPGMKGGVSFALVDCDLRDSIHYCLAQIWPRLAPGGRILVDDYGHDDWRGAKLGVDDFVREHGDEISQHGLLRRFYLICKR